RPRLEAERTVGQRAGHDKAPAERRDAGTDVPGERDQPYSSEAAIRDSTSHSAKVDPTSSMNLSPPSGRSTRTLTWAIMVDRAAPTGKLLSDRSSRQHLASMSRERGPETTSTDRPHD